MVRAPAAGRSVGVLLAGDQALVGAAGQVAGAALFGPVGGALLAGLDAGLDGSAGDGGDAVLGGLGVLVVGGGGDAGAEQLDLFTAAGPPPLLGRRCSGGSGEVRVELQERLHPIWLGAAGWDRAKPSAGRPATAGLGMAGALVGMGAAGDAAGFAVFLADWAVTTGPALPLELPLPSAGDAGPGAGQAQADAGLGDDLDQPSTPASQVLGQAVVQVLGPVLDLP